MRLTLRTLLAYMDGLLDPKDSQEIGKKIEESKFATELFHKIRDVMRRLRLGAPSVTERAANLDCNTVAEYLDNAMPSDRVPDFEEVSLKSEMHLAEVASCHQILTMVLGEPVEIDPESRQRMYQLPTVANLVDEERLAAVEAASMLSGDGNGAVPPPPPVKVRPRPVVPEYLREPPRKSRLLPAAAIMILVGALAGLLWVSVDPNGWRWVQAKLHGKAADEDRDEQVVKKPAMSQESLAAARGAAARSSGSAAGASVTRLPLVGKDSGAPLAAGAKTEVPVPPAEGAPLTAGLAPGGPGLPPAPGLPSGTGTPSVAGTPPGSVTPPAMAANQPPRPVGSEAGPKSPVPSVARPAQPGQGANAAVPNTPPGGPAAGAAGPKPPGEVVALGPPATPRPAGMPPGAGPGGPPVMADKTKIGRYMSDGQDVLLKYEANNAGWRRILPEEFLGGRQPLLALPSYRPRIGVLNVGATLDLINGTRVELLPDDALGPPGVDIDFGRVVVKPLGQEGTRVRVAAGGHMGIIKLGSTDSVVGLEVTRMHEPGTDPERVLSHALAKLYVARGSASWEESEGKPPVRLTAPAELLLDGGSPDSPGAAKDLPKWITANTINELDQRAALAVSQALSPDRAASLGLNELTLDRKKEIRWLVARCLGYLGQFDPMAAALNNPDYHSEWYDYIDQLKEAIARGPETAAAIRQALEKQYGNDAPALYRMLWGYTDKQLEEGEDARLVKYLDHESPVFRVLAFESLREITHQLLYYRPDATAAKRLSSVQQWRRQQEAGRIRHAAVEAKPRSGPGELPPKAAPPPPRPAPPAAVAPVSAEERVEPTAKAAGNPPWPAGSAVAEPSPPPAGSAGPPGAPARFTEPATPASGR